MYISNVHEQWWFIPNFRFFHTYQSRQYLSDRENQSPEKKTNKLYHIDLLKWYLNLYDRRGFVLYAHSLDFSVTVTPKKRENIYACTTCIWLK